MASLEPLNVSAHILRMLMDRECMGFASEYFLLLLWLHEAG